MFHIPEKKEVLKAMGLQDYYAEKEAPSDLSIIVLYLCANSGQPLIFIENCP
ncbi:hypothetical protein OAQ07_01830 [Flavobacteriaceae bacterium]|nr:hypothetical protein [Flavobacteriaceae bacterium]